MREKLAAFVAQRREELVKLLSELVAAKTENPPGNERLAAEVVAQFLRRCNIPYRTWEAEPNRTNIIGTVGRGRPRILIAAHLDVVPAGHGWQTDPFQAVVQGDYIYGRGASDNKGAAAAMLLAGEFLKQIEPELKGEVWLAGVADEERGSYLGLGFLMKRGLLAVDCALVPDVAEHSRLIDVAEKGALFVELISHGRQAHGSRPQEGVNAIWHMIRLLEQLRACELPHVPHRFLTAPTLNLGQIEGGSAPNMVPARCRAAIDLRYLPGTTECQMLELVRSVVAQVQAETGGRFEVKLILSHPPTELPEDHPLVHALAAATEEVLGARPKVGGMSGATVVKELLAAGIPAVGCGPGEPGMAHAANERALIGELCDFSRILVLTCLKLMEAGAS